MTKRTIWHQTVDMTWLNNLQQLSTSRTKAMFSFVRVSNSHRRNNAVKLLLWCSFAWCQIFCFTLFVPNCLLPNCLFSYLGADLSICLIPDICLFLHGQNFWRIKFTPKKRVNYDKINRELPIFCVITTKYTVNWQFFALNL